MKIDYDVIIIGAGPAGASCAKYLVDNGVRTLVVEKQKLPRYKCCWGLYSNRSIDFIKNKFEDIPKEFYSKNEEVSVLASRKGDNYIPLGFNFFNLKREKVDFWLINKSKAKIYDRCIYWDHIYENNIYHIRLKDVKNKKDIVLTTKYLIDATGANSKIRKKMDPKYNKNINFGIQVIYEGYFDKINPNFFYTIKNKKFSDYFSYFYLKDDLIYIGTSASKKEYLFNLLNFLNTKYKLNLKKTKTTGSYLDFFKGEENCFFGEKNILLIGESTGLISNLSEGIPSALISGLEAATSIIENNGNALTEYKVKIKNEIELLKNNIFLD